VANKNPNNIKDLKARLGLGNTTPPAGSGRRVVPPQTGVPGPKTNASGFSPLASPNTKSQAGGGFAPIQAGTAPIVETQRNKVNVPVIENARPEINVPSMNKGLSKGLLIGLGVLFGIGLILGTLFGSVAGQRKLRNATIEDARRIKDKIAKVTDANNQIIAALTSSTTRNNNHVRYDPQLIDDLKKVIATTKTETSPEAKENLENNVFKSHYSNMGGVTVSKLMEYVHNSVRLHSYAREVVKLGETNKDSIEAFIKDKGKRSNKSYGVVVSKDVGKYFVGTIVEMAGGACAAGKKTCAPSEFDGFYVRSIGGRNSVKKKGKAGKSAGKGIVIPIEPNADWASVAYGSEAAAVYGRVVTAIRDLGRTAALLDASKKPLLDALDSEAGKSKRLAI